jgi:hypothetical protein
MKMWLLVTSLKAEWLVHPVTNNVSVGNLSMNGITTGNSNTGIGNGAFGGITTWSLNIGIGAGANGRLE